MTDRVLGTLPLPPGGPIEAVPEHADSIFNWQYDMRREALVNLYEKGKRLQWNATTDIDWSIDVDPEAFPEFFPPEAFNAMLNPPRKLELRELKHMRVHQLGWMLSQFMHGEQGALLATAQIVNTVPWTEAKFYAASQVADEARHVEVYRRYLTEKLPYAYPVNPHLHTLLGQIIREPRWDMTYLGMQIMVEGLALAAFGMMHQITTEPLLKKLLRYVMSDEARHVAFGVLSLQELYAGLSDAEVRERQEFAFDVARRLQRRFAHTEMWERMGVDPAAVYRTMDGVNPPAQQMFQQMLFSKIVPNCKKLGLLDASGGWLRERFSEIGVIQFENWVDTGEEYAELDEVAKDKAVA
jgi:hypothetical protein